MPLAICDHAHVEIDHLVPLELGGTNDIRNLWPQPIQSAAIKDIVENAMRRQVCAGTMDLHVAQRRLETDWYALYLEVSAVVR